MSDESNIHSQTSDQLMAIANEIQSNQAMIGPLVSPLSLVSDYEASESPSFVVGIQYLARIYPAMRRIRGDGNCFYRAFLFAYLEGLLSKYNGSSADDKEAAIAEKERFMATIVSSKDELVAQGYSEIAIESFHDMLVELLAGLFSHSADSLLALFQEDGQSDYYTWFMRLLTAGRMRREAQRYAPFLADGCGSSGLSDADSSSGSESQVESYCKREVEPMGKECEQLQVIALTEYLGVTVRIEYLDGRPFEESVGIPHIICPEPAVAETGAMTAPVPLVRLLYRPGHYDILDLRKGPNRLIDSELVRCHSPFHMT